MSSPAISAPRPTGSREPSPWARSLEQLLLAAAVLTLVLMVWHVLRGHWAAFDFQYAYWRAGHQMILGTSPYAWTHAQVVNKIIFVYPALSAVMFALLSLIPRGAGSVLSMLLCVALVPITLRLLGVRDRGVYAIVLLWLPVYAAWQTATRRCSWSSASPASGAGATARWSQGSSPPR